MPATNIDDVQLIIEDDNDKHRDHGKLHDEKQASPRNKDREISPHSRPDGVKVTRTSSFQKRNAPPPVLNEQKPAIPENPNPAHVQSQKQNAPRAPPQSGENRVSNSAPRQTSHSGENRSSNSGRPPSHSGENRAPHSAPRPPSHGGENRASNSPPNQHRPERLRSMGSEERRRSDRERKHHDQSASPKASHNSYQPGNPPAPPAPAGQQGARYPSGPNSFTLSDLKRHRAESRSRENSVTDLSSAVQSMFINSLNANDAKKYSNSSLHGDEKGLHNNKNGHSTNNNTQAYGLHQEKIHRFKAPGNTPVVGGDEKQGCCVVM